MEVPWKADPVAVRDSKAPEGPVLRLSRGCFRQFVDRVREPRGPQQT